MSAPLRDWPLIKEPRLRALMRALDGDQGLTRIVGGAVRNALMGQPASDADLATLFPPPEVIRRAQAAGFKTVPTGIEHGTVTVIVDGQPFEVTTLRRDVETDGRRAVVSFTKDWREDAGRRDFTMNALYCDVGGEVLDVVGGVEDLKAGRVRFIGEAEDRIREDYLRILRFFRFTAWYGKGRPDAEGIKACAKLKAGIATLSAERVWAELKRLLKAPDPTRALLWMRTTEVLQKTLPESWGIDALPRTVAAGAAEGWPPDPLFRLQSILPPHRARIDGMAERLRLSRAEAARLLAWADTPEPDPDMSEAEIARTLYRHGREGVIDRLRHALARELDKDNAEAAAKLRRLEGYVQSWTKPILPVTGKDLVAAGISPGPDVGARLRALEERWIDSGFSLSREALLEM